MNEVQSTSRIHPLVAVAAVSVTLVSLVGIAAITGVLPSSHGTTAQTISDSTAGPSRVPSGQATPVDSAGIDSTPKVLHGVPQTQHARAAQAGTQVANNSAALPQAATPQPVSAAKPAPQNSAVGIGLGALIGGVLGNQVGSGDGKVLTTIAGAVGGGYVGNEVAKKIP